MSKKITQPAKLACSFLRASAGVGLIISTISIPFPALADDESDGTRTWHVHGSAVTGANDRCGVPQWQLPPPFNKTHYTVVGLYNPAPGAIDGIPASPENCNNDAVLATTVNLAMQIASNSPDADARIKNIPYRQVPLIAGMDGVRQTLPGMDTFPPNPFPPTRSQPDAPITLGDWLKAQGDMTIQCYRDGSAKVKAHFRNLIPHGLYSVHATWKTTMPGTNQVTFAPVAFGGIPNLMVAGEEGSADFERKLNYCPKYPSPDGSDIMFVDVGYHLDGTAYGAFPAATLDLKKFRTPAGDEFESYVTPGTVTAVQLGFPINAIPLR